ncbi:hypothetical protein [Agromyces sp. Marseille-Q5079]|uniref:hypothetical protein n=1 Tax=Agromyces sp. Marseille-Q5079 TaxID=3439059 RepID=UPI003D9C98C6
MNDRQHDDLAAEPTTDTQDAPVQEGSLTDADDGARLEGVVEQVRGDVLFGQVDDLPQMVRERLEQAGLPASPNDVDAVISAVQSTP